MSTTDLFRDFTPKEISQFGRLEVARAKDKFPKNFDAPDGQMIEGYQYLSGEISDTSQLEYGTYCNELYDAWKAWAPKFCSRPPSWIVRPANRESGQPLADACQELFRYRQKKFDYQDLALRLAQDAIICGIGYARHSWDKKMGMTVTSRFKPQNVFPDAGATTWSKQTQIIEKHTMTRWQFAQKYGKKVAYEIGEADGGKDAGEGRYWPSGDKYEIKGKGPLDPIEYYLLWSIHGGHKRVYAFHLEYDDQFLQPECRKAGKCVGEEWPLDYEDGEWHLTPLIPTVLNDRIIGISAWNVVRGTYLMYQNLLGASVKSDLQSVKRGVMVPDTMKDQVVEFSKNGETLFFLKYDAEALLGQGQKIEDLVSVLELGEVSPALQKNVSLAQSRFQQLMGQNAVAQIQPGGVETAAEATKLADAANNRVADDQGAVERCFTKIGRKELQGDLLRMPQRSVLKVELAEEGEEELDDDAEGETPDENPTYLRNVPYEEAILLEKGPASDAAALKMESLREQARSSSMMADAFGQGDGSTPEDAEEQIPVTPEVEVRRKWGVPVLAEVEIVNPGAEQFIGPKASGWPARAMSLREIENAIGVRVEPGTSSATGKMQAMQEMGMAFKSLYEFYASKGMNLQLAALNNAFIAKMESDLMDDCRTTQQELDEKDQAIAQAQQAQQQAELQAKQPTGDNPEIVKMQADAEMAKAQTGVITSKEKTRQIELKNEGDAARDRSKNFQMQVASQTMAPVNGAM